MQFCDKSDQTRMKYINGCSLVECSISLQMTFHVCVVTLALQLSREGKKGLVALPFHFLMLIMYIYHMTSLLFSG